MAILEMNGGYEGIVPGVPFIDLGSDTDEPLVITNKPPNSGKKSEPLMPDGGEVLPGLVEGVSERVSPLLYK